MWMCLDTHDDLVGWTVNRDPRETVADHFHSSPSLPIPRTRPATHPTLPHFTNDFSGPLPQPLSTRLTPHLPISLEVDLVSKDLCSPLTQFLSKEERIEERTSTERTIDTVYTRHTGTDTVATGIM